jgi:putative FmdB family regulatory protein
MMPIYILKCPKCKTQFDFYKLRKSSTALCPKCGITEGFEKIPTAASVNFHGEGWTTPNYNEGVDPTSVKGVKKIDKPTLEQKTLYKTRKPLTGKRRKVKVDGLPEKRRRFAVGKE